VTTTPAVATCKASFLIMIVEMGDLRVLELEPSRRRTRQKIYIKLEGPWES
jgi:hypothetical protein